jgi:threonine dehydrogenase-like Zn-dependent dehydrogenase
MAVALSRVAGAKRICVSHPSTGEARVSVARRLGADAVFHPDTADVVAAIREVEPRGVDVVLVTAPLSKTIDQAVGAVTTGGTIAFVGMEWRPDVSLGFNVDWFHFQKLRLVGSNHNPCSRLYPDAVRLVAEKKIDASLLVSHSFPLADIQRALDQAGDRASAVKTMVDCS